MKPRVACSTSDGDRLFGDKFGDSPYFHLYEIDVEGFNFLEKVENISDEGEEDETTEKVSKSDRIASLLKSKSVNVLLAHQIGPNILRISKDFVPIISRELDIHSALSSVRDKLHLVEREWRKGESREYLVIEEDRQNEDDKEG